MSHFYRCVGASQIRASSSVYVRRMERHRRSRQLKAGKGSTMLELVIVMAIVGILLSIGIPAFFQVTSANRVAGEVNGLLGDMQYARAEAIKEGQLVGICVSDNSASAAPSCTPSNQWQSGWVVYSDLNGDGTLDNNEPVLRAQKPFTSTDSFAASGGIAAVSFNREGFATNLPAATVTITLHLAGSYPGSIALYTRCLAITTIGGLATEIPPTGGCN